MAMRRELIRLGDTMKETAKDQNSDDDASAQIQQAEMQLYNLAEIGGTQTGFVSFEDALIDSIEMATAAYQRKGQLSGISTGLEELDRLLGDFTNLTL